MTDRPRGDAELDAEMANAMWAAPIELIDDELLRRLRARDPVCAAFLPPALLRGAAKMAGRPIEATPAGRVFVRIFTAIGWAKVYEDASLIRPSAYDPAATWGTLRFRADPEPAVPAMPGPVVGYERPPRESYARTTVDFGGYTSEPAVEWREGDRWDAVIGELEAIVHRVFVDAAPPKFPAEAVRRLGDLIAERWPDRAYFVEVWQGERRGFAQVFQPYGVPRNRP